MGAPPIFSRSYARTHQMVSLVPWQEQREVSIRTDSPRVSNIRTRKE
ncbi:hypothetical protein JMJ77_0006956 [Colletotrichum scovillei]|uniref:Uncharacterized protein n=1 Tax=Colletotrichum scovillei TaxID=1209932 RepID=A0A9P7UF64_9PEZI|nr:hypothetical protein JMJ77_0006956 [Colletotrichum scovillei]KAG7073917.1 hypothetical protein JMJ76_0010411 [Colletotrichum scovillei]KAG7081466.1 hypothetical protein JMJ78_0003588 [Colletotrichum scovillei]